VHQQILTDAKLKTGKKGKKQSSLEEDIKEEKVRI
jgi:hypothetical protein